MYLQNAFCPVFGACVREFFNARLQTTPPGSERFAPGASIFNRRLQKMYLQNVFCSCSAIVSGGFLMPGYKPRHPM
jgi:hypothetical protein